MLRLVSALLLTAALDAETWPLDRLFARPYIWGTRPGGDGPPASSIKWARDGSVLVFRWNAAGNRFLDLYAWSHQSRQLVRLTDLATFSDPLNRSAAEKDDRQKSYVEPDEGIAAFDLSRDGKRAVFAHRGDLWVVDTAGGRPPFRLTRTRSAEAEPQWSPDGTRVGYIRDGQVYTQDLVSGALTQITDVEAGDAGGLATFRWAPGGRSILYTQRAGAGRRLLLPNFTGRLVSAAPFPRTLPGDQPVESRLFVVPAEGGTAKQLEAGTWGGKAYAFAAPFWSPDSRSIAQGLIHADLKRAQVVVWDAATGRQTVVNEESDPAWAATTELAWSPDSRELAFTSERDGFAHLYATAASGGVQRQITRGRWEVSDERGWGHEPQWVGDYLYFASTEPGPSQRAFYRVHADGTGKEALSRGEGVHTGIVAEDGTVALLSAALDRPFDLYVAGEPVTRSVRAEFAQYPWPAIRFIEFPSRGDGRAVQGKITLPPGYRPEDKSRQWPAVFFIHGSGYATSILRQWGAYQAERFVFNSYLANHGYVVFDLDYRGSSGYGRDWRSGVYLHMGGKDLEDVLGLVDYAGRLGNIDAKRIGIWGWSYGGFMTNMAMFLAPDAFRAGAAFSAVNDWENYNAFYTEQRLGKPQEHPEAYRRSSPILFSSFLKNPLLMLHGMVDNNVMFQDAVQLAEKLIHEGKPFEQAYYPEESHSFVRDEAYADAFRRATEFFDRNLR